MNLPTWMKWATGVMLVSFALVAATGCGASSSEKDSEPATTEKAEAPKPEPPDTGRMSSGEFDSFKANHADFVEEVTAYGRELGGKCASMAAVGQLAEFFDCEDDAYDGVIGSYSLADGDWSSMRDDDVAKGCKKALAKSVKTLNRLADMVVGTHEMASNGELTGDLLGAALGGLLKTRSAAYLKSYRATVNACRPA